MPGMKPRIVSAILMRRSTPHPFSANTPNGGNMMANIILQISEQVNGIFHKILAIYY
jgi:hypothetical protein